MGIYDSIIDKEYGLGIQTKYQNINNDRFDEDTYYSYCGMNVYHEGDEVPVPDGEYSGIASWTFYDEPLKSGVFEFKRPISTYRLHRLFKRFK